MNYNKIKKMAYGLLENLGNGDGTVTNMVLGREHTEKWIQIEEIPEIPEQKILKILTHPDNALLFEIETTNGEREVFPYDVDIFVDGEKNQIIFVSDELPLPKVYDLDKVEDFWFNI